MDKARKTRPVEKHMSGKWGREKAIQGTFLAPAGGHILHVSHAFRATYTATICSGFDISPKCHFFSKVFKALTDEKFITYCFNYIKRQR
jgi:hypothetical protein